MLADFVAQHRTTLDEELTRAGGLLFTGFSVSDATAFRASVIEFGEDTLPYLERAAVRHEVAEGVFTSTEFSSSNAIDLHHEMSFARRIPARIFFYAKTLAAKGGETPIADEYAATEEIDLAVREEFLARGVTYVRNYRPEIDMDWRSAFQTDNRADVEHYCKANGIDFEWVSADHLRTEQKQAAFLRSPVNGMLLFCNHAHIFHRAAMDGTLLEALLDIYGEGGLVAGGGQQIGGVADRQAGHGGQQRLDPRDLALAEVSTERAMRAQGLEELCPVHVVFIHSVFIHVILP